MAGGVPTTPSAPIPPSYKPPSGSSSGSKSGGTAKPSSGGGGGGGGSKDPYAQARADQARRDRKAGNRYAEQARNLQGQADALLRALRKEFRKGLNIRLDNVANNLAQADALLLDGYRERVGSLEEAASDNVKASETQTGINRQNVVRERNSALAEAMANGAGESDALNAQLASLRNWQANQSEIQRSFFDTLTGINTSLTDLNVDTKTARVNAVVQANSDREQLWSTYYNQRSETFTNLGNTYGQQADYLSSAKEYGVGGGGKGKAGAARKAFMQASKEAGKAWENPGVSKRLMNWDGRDEFTTAQTKKSAAAQLAGAATVSLDQRPEGATLRKW